MDADVDVDLVSDSAETIPAAGLSFFFCSAVDAATITDAVKKMGVGKSDSYFFV